MSWSPGTSTNKALDIGIGEPVIGLHLIDMLDESGWLSSTTDDVADLLGCEVERVQTVLKRIQQFDPPGVFARGLKVFDVQLRDLGRLDPAMEALIENLSCSTGAIKRRC